jgi:hypothetical protein
MTTITILVILFLGALAALGLQVVFAKKTSSGKNGGGVTAHKDIKPEKQKKDENN